MSSQHNISQHTKWDSTVEHYSLLGDIIADSFLVKYKSPCSLCAETLSCLNLFRSCAWSHSPVLSGVTLFPWIHPSPLAPRISLPPLPHSLPNPSGGGCVWWGHLDYKNSTFLISMLNFPNLKTLPLKKSASVNNTHKNKPSNSYKSFNIPFMTLCT